MITLIALCDVDEKYAKLIAIHQRIGGAIIYVRSIIIYLSVARYYDVAAHLTCGKG